MTNQLGAIKHDAGKPGMTLIPWDVMRVLEPTVEPDPIAVLNRWWMREDPGVETLRAAASNVIILHQKLYDRDGLTVDWGIPDFIAPVLEFGAKKYTRRIPLTTEEATECLKQHLMKLYPSFAITIQSETAEVSVNTAPAKSFTTSASGQTPSGMQVSSKDRENGKSSVDGKTGWCLSNLDPRPSSANTLIENDFPEQACASPATTSNSASMIQNMQNGSEQMLESGQLEIPTKSEPSTSVVRPIPQFGIDYGLPAKKPVFDPSEQHPKRSKSFEDFKAADAPYASAHSKRSAVCISITVTPPGTSAVSFAVGATTVLECFAKIQKRFTELWPISPIPPFPAFVEKDDLLELVAPGAWNWAKGFIWSRPYSAAIRHIRGYNANGVFVGGMINGVRDDPETGLYHAGHALCCITFLTAFQMWNKGQDDRPELTP